MDGLKQASIVFFLLLVPLNTAMAGNWDHCPPIPPAPIPETNEEDTETSVSADEALRIGQDTYLFRGQVHLHAQDQSLITDEANYNEGTGDLLASGNIYYRKKVLELQGSKLQ